MKIRKYPYYFSSVINLLTGFTNWPLVARIFLRVAPPGPYLIELRKSGIKLKARGIMDIWSIKETFIDRFYERFGVRVEDGWTIVDIGGGIGDYTLFAAIGHPHSKVCAFEPFPESFALLQENVRANGAANVQAFPEAVWSQAGDLTMDSSIGEPGQFISRGVGDVAVAAPAIQAPATVVSSVSMADAFARLGIEQCDLMKVDCEGAEYPILFNAPDAVLERIRRIIMEYHDSVTAYTHRDMEKFLIGKGFKVRLTPSYVHDDLGYLYAWRG